MRDDISGAARRQRWTGGSRTSEDDSELGVMTDTSGRGTGKVRGGRRGGGAGAGPPSGPLPGRGAAGRQHGQRRGRQGGPEADEWGAGDAHGLFGEGASGGAVVARQCCGLVEGGMRGTGRCGRAGWLFVQNLPGSIGTAALKYVFAYYGKVRKIHVMNARSANVRACAFVQYLFSCEAALAVRMLDGTYEMQPGLGPISLQVDAPGIFVENLPNDVREEMLSYVFSFYGKVQTVHVATGHSRAGRAHAFIEYSLAVEAESATRALHQVRAEGGSFTGLEDVGTEEGSDFLPLLPSETEGPEERLREGAGASARELACVVCLAASKTHAFVPCGHRCVCADCGGAVVEQAAATCPICRAVVEHVLQIFC